MVTIYSLDYGGSSSNPGEGKIQKYVLISKEIILVNSLIVKTKFKFWESMYFSEVFSPIICSHTTEESFL